MRMLSQFTSLSGAVILYGLIARAAAQEPKLPVENANSKIVLFDGKTLEGWRAAAFGGSGEVKVEDGAIHLGTGRRMTGITTSRSKLPKLNYELTYEAQRVEGSDFFAAATFPVGDAFITLVNGGWGGSVTGLSSLNGADASENDTTTYVKYKNNKWYRFKVWVTTEVIRAWVDEKQVIDVAINGREVKTRIETRGNQPLGFATYASAGLVRNVEIRALTEAELALMKPKEED